MGYPPFASFFHILLTGEAEAEVREAAEAFAEAVQKADGEKIALVLGPIPAALPKFRGEYRYQLTLQAQDEEKLRSLVLAAQEEWKKRKGIRLHLALNPTNIV